MIGAYGGVLIDVFVIDHNDVIGFVPGDVCCNSDVWGAVLMWDRQW
jgi:hypothetical protein